MAELSLNATMTAQPVAGMIELKTPGVALSPCVPETIRPGLNISRFAMNTATIAGTLEEKLLAMSDAGFSKIELWSKDLVDHPGGVEGGVKTIRESGMTVANFKLLRDYEGLYGSARDYKLDVASSLMDLMDRIDAKLLLVVSSTNPNATGDIDTLGLDLAALGSVAEPRGIRIGYEALSWGRWVNDYAAAWEVVKRADRPNVGLVLDSIHALLLSTDLVHLNAIPAEKIFLVQLSDYLWYNNDVIDTSRHHRVFVGEGAHGFWIAELLRRLGALGYSGDYSLEVFNDDYLSCAPAGVARRARRAVDWVSAQIQRNNRQ
jgi:2-keto-myo-inositol isomerase